MINFDILDKKILFSSNSDLEIINTIKKYEFNINEESDFGSWTILISACESGRKELVKFLLTYKDININHKNRYGDTALQVCWNKECLQELLRHKNIDVRTQNKYNRTALFSSRTISHVESVIELLLDARIDPFICDNWNNTAQDIALYWGRYRSAKIIGNIQYTSLLRIPNGSLIYDIVRTIIREYL